MAPPYRKAFSPRHVNDYWIGQRGTLKELSTIAELKWAAIASNGACERVFSHLLHMDDPKRRTIKHKALENALMLRFNRPIVERLAKQLSDDIAFNRGSLKLPTGSAYVRENQRKRAAAAAAASSAAKGVAVLSATAVAQKRARIIDSDEDDEDDEGRAGEGGAAVGAVQSGSSRKRARRDSFSEDENPFVGDGFD